MEPYVGFGRNLLMNTIHPLLFRSKEISRKFIWSNLVNLYLKQNYVTAEVDFVSDCVRLQIPVGKLS